MSNVLRLRGDDETLPIRLRAERARRGLTQADVGRELGVRPQTIGDWELGQKVPQTRFHPDLARFLGLADAAEIKVLLGQPATPPPTATKRSSDELVSDRLLGAIATYVNRATGPLTPDELKLLIGMMDQARS